MPTGDQTVLYPLESALGRGMTQATKDRDAVACLQLKRAQEALSRISPLFFDAARELSTHEEKFARDLLMDIVDRNTGDINGLTLVPLVLFLQNCTR